MLFIGRIVPVIFCPVKSGDMIGIPDVSPENPAQTSDAHALDLNDAPVQVAMLRILQVAPVLFAVRVVIAVDHPYGNPGINQGANAILKGDGRFLVAQKDHSLLLILTSLGNHREDVIEVAVNVTQKINHSFSPETTSRVISRHTVLWLSFSQTEKT